MAYASGTHLRDLLAEEQQALVTERQLVAMVPELEVALTEARARFSTMTAASLPAQEGHAMLSDYVRAIADASGASLPDGGAGEWLPSGSPHNVVLNEVVVIGNIEATLLTLSRTENGPLHVGVRAFALSCGNGAPLWSIDLTLPSACQLRMTVVAPIQPDLAALRAKQEGEEPNGSQSVEGA